MRLPRNMALSDVYLSGRFIGMIRLEVQLMLLNYKYKFNLNDFRFFVP